MTRPLSPKQIAKRWQDYRFAVVMIARNRAKQAVQAQLKDAGLRVSLIPPAQIRPLADAYMTQHRDRLIADAKHAIATSPYFVKYRKPEEPEFLEK
jgi:uroporphyrinogen-III synthase